MSNTRNALVEWKVRCGLTSFAHHRVQAKYHKRHVHLGIALMACTTITGTSSFAKLGEAEAAIGALIVILTLIAGILAGVQTFLDYKSVGEQHKNAASGWEDLRWKIETILASTPEDQDVAEAKLTEVSDVATKLRRQSPTIHNDYWDEAKDAFEASSIE